MITSFSMHVQYMFDGKSGLHAYSLQRMDGGRADDA